VHFGAFCIVVVIARDLIHDLTLQCGLDEPLLDDRCAAKYTAMQLDCTGIGAHST